MEIKDEITAELMVQSPKSKRSKAGGVLSNRGAESENSFSAIDSADDIEQLDPENTSMEDLIRQLNEMNSKIPARLEKFQKALEEKQKVTDAKLKR